MRRCGRAATTFFSRERSTALLCFGSSATRQVFHFCRPFGSLISKSITSAVGTSRHFAVITIRSLSGANRHSASRAFRTEFMSTRPNAVAKRDGDCGCTGCFLIFLPSAGRRNDQWRRNIRDLPPSALWSGSGQLEQRELPRFDS